MYWLFEVLLHLTQYMQYANAVKTTFLYNGVKIVIQICRNEQINR